jgi:exopolyphosphatase/guanosine-5'-triphosphate,3'-diphosphate pyrophosphatase
MIMFHHLGNQQPHGIRAYIYSSVTHISNVCINSKEIITFIKNETGIEIEVIGGKREAEIIYTNHVAESLEHDKSYLYIDVGGGSTELTLFSKGKILESNSFKIGTLRLLMEQDLKQEWQLVKDWLKRVNSSHHSLIGIGTGGNINKMAKMIEKKENKPITYQEIKAIQAYLNAFTVEERISKLGMNEDRADVIEPAARIFITLMKYADISQLIVPKLGLADGIIHYLYEKHLKTNALGASNF